MTRKPPANASVSVRDFLDAERGAELGPEWLQRYFALRRRGLVMPLLAAAIGKPGYYVATNLVNPWREKKYVSFDELRETIVRVEAESPKASDAA